MNRDRSASPPMSHGSITCRSASDGGCLVRRPGSAKAVRPPGYQRCQEQKCDEDQYAGDGSPAVGERKQNR